MDCLICHFANKGVEFTQIRESEWRLVCQTLNSLSQFFVFQLESQWRDQRICQSCATLLAKIKSTKELVESHFENLVDLEGNLSRLFINACYSDTKKVLNGMRIKMWKEILRDLQSKSLNARTGDSVGSIEDSKLNEELRLTELINSEFEIPVEIPEVEIPEVEICNISKKSFDENGNDVSQTSVLDSQMASLSLNSLAKKAQSEKSFKSSSNRVTGNGEIGNSLGSIDNFDLESEKSGLNGKKSKMRNTLEFLKAGGGVPCKVCNKRYKDKKAVKIHMNLHTRKVLHCTKCPREFKTEERLRDHNLLCHSSTQWKKPFECDQCDKSFFSAPSLKNHVQKWHGVQNSQVEETGDEVLIVGEREKEKVPEIVVVD